MNLNLFHSKAWQMLLSWFKNCLWKRIWASSLAVGNFSKSINANSLPCSYADELCHIHRKHEPNEIFSNIVDTFCSVTDITFNCFTLFCSLIIHSFLSYYAVPNVYKHIRSLSAAISSTYLQYKHSTIEQKRQPLYWHYLCILQRCEGPLWIFGCSKIWSKKSSESLQYILKFLEHVRSSGGFPHSSHLLVIFHWRSR